MDALYVQAIPRLSQAGDSFNVAGHINVGEYFAAGEKRQIDGGVDYDVVFSHTGEGILLSGIAKAKAKGLCSRCLKLVEYDVSGEVEGYYIFAGDGPAADDELDEFDAVGEDGTIEILGPVMAAVVYDTPYLLFCTQDCKGLCPSCGADLNLGPCGCPPKKPVGKNNPFAVLDGLIGE